MADIEGMIVRGSIIIGVTIIIVTIGTIISYFYKKKKKKLRIGLALGSGGSWGLAHIGVLKVLEENNIPIDCIVGSSMGAIIGACYSINPNADELERKAISLTKKDLIKLIDLVVPKVSLISGNKIRKFIEELVQDKNFLDTKIPLKIITTDLESGEEFVIDKGKLVDPIMASISIPGIFPPVKLQNRLLVDGGVINPTPSNVVKRMDSNVLIGVDLTMKNKVNLGNSNIFQTLMRTYEILRTQSAKFNIDEKDNNLLIIKPDVARLKSFKIYEIKRFIEEGERATKKALPEIKKLISK